MKKALLTGITGQDGSYLAELLLSKGYEVHGIIRRASHFNTQRIDHIYTDPHYHDVKLHLHYGDLSDPGILTDIVYNTQPDEIYNLGAQSHVRVSFDMPEYTGNISGLSVTRILEAIRRSGSKAKFYQASSSELFGSAPSPQNETTAFRPKSPYAAAKLYAYWMTVNYRESYDLFASNGILFNHESPRRGETFVTRKISRAIASIIAGTQDKLYLGNLDAKRDWGFAPEYVEMMWLILQQDKADDYVAGTGQSHSVREFLEEGLNYCGIELDWDGDGIEEKGMVKSISGEYGGHLKTGDVLVEIDPRYFRPAEVDYLKADISKAQKELGWQPKVNFTELVRLMVDHDLNSNNILPPGKGVESVEAKGINWTKHKLVNFGDIKYEV